MTLTQQHIKKYKTDKHKIFVESGTYVGDGVQLAIDCGFEKIISVEISKKYYEYAAERFSSNKSVNIIFGDSYFEFQKICQSLNEPVFFWLDGHFDRFGDTQGFLKCPLLKELDWIKSMSINNNIIVIDDLRVFGNLNEIDWGIDLNLEEIITKIKNINKNYHISYEDGWKKNDILFAYL